MNPIRILIVEDQAIVARDLSQRVQALGYNLVGPAHTAEDALRLADEQRPDIALMDIQLPGGMDGIQAAMVLRESYGIPVVFLTAFTEEGTLQRAKVAEPYGYVVKPFEDRELRAVLEIALHKHAIEDRLRASAAAHRTILNTTLDGYFLTDAQGRFLEVNEAYARMTGYTRTELLQRSLADLESGDSAEPLAAFLQNARLAGSARFQRSQRRKDGSISQLDVSMKCLPGDDGRIFCFLRDITRRAELEREREIVVHLLGVASRTHSLEDFARESIVLLLGCLDCDVVALDIPSGTVSHHFKGRRNPASFTHSEGDLAPVMAPGPNTPPCPTGAPPGAPPRACLCARTRAGFVAADPSHNTGRGSFWTGNGSAPESAPLDCPAHPGCLLHPTPPDRWLSLALVPLAVGPSITGLLQIGDRRPDHWSATSISLIERLADHLAIAIAHLLAQEALRSSEASYRGLFNTIGLAVGIQDREGRFLDVNDGAIAMYGYSREEFLGHTPEFLAAPNLNDLPDFHDRIRRAHAGEPQQLEFLGRRRDGNIFPSAIQLYRGTYFGKEVVIAIAADITEAKRLEERLLHSQKMEAIGQLAGGIAHDFNNILASMMLQIGLLQVNLAHDPGNLADLQELGLVAERAANLTRQLLLFSRRSVIQAEDLHLNEIVGEMTRSLLRLLGEQVELVFDGAPGLRLIHADPGMVQQVILNLCVNARDAMPRGGRLELRTLARTLDPHSAAANPDARPGHFVCLVVRDTGCGMDTPTLRRIFEPFFTSKQPGKGTGLGLAMVYGIIQQHRGWIEVETQPDQGTTFTVYFPTVESPTPASTPAGTPPVPTAPPGGTENLLLVEDNDSLRHSLAAYLRFLGYTVHEALDGPSALAAWETHGPDVDLVLTDMVMPAGLSGLDLADRLRQVRPDLRIIVSSGYSAELETRTAAAHHVTFLPKPYLPAELALAIRSCLDQPAPQSDSPAPPLTPAASRVRSIPGVATDGTPATGSITPKCS